VSEKNVVRTAALTITVSSVVLPIFMAVPARLPATAMGSELLLYVERLLAVFTVLLFLLVFLYRSLVHGELPRAVSGRGAEWSETLTAARSLQSQIDDLAAALRAGPEKEGG
jgi:hypothetical protein